MRYAYQDISSGQFEELVYSICLKLFGLGVQRFSTGPDGGRDARFAGRAERFPSSTQPWEGSTIIQAKHTSGLNKSFSDREFFGSDSSILGKELPKVQSLRQRGELDNYILFSNRRLSSLAEERIRRSLSRDAKMEKGSIVLCGVEQLEGWLKEFPDIPARVKLDPLDSPLIVSPDELADVIEALAQQQSALAERLTTPPTPRVPYVVKNRLNNMSDNFAAVLQRQNLKDTPIVRDFLADPINARYLALYQSVTEEFQLKVAAHRREYQTFDAVYNHLLDLLFDREQLLRSNRRLTRLVLFYMYWNCDLGVEHDAKA